MNARVARVLIGQHEDIALIAAIVVGLLGVLSLWALWRYRRAATLPRRVGAAALVLSLAGSGLMAWTGPLGGEIRHTAVRPGLVMPPSAAR